MYGILKASVLNVLLMSFEAQKFFIVMKSDLSVVVCAFGVIPKKALLNPRSQGFMPPFSPKSLRV